MLIVGEKQAEAGEEDSPDQLRQMVSARPRRYYCSVSQHVRVGAYVHLQYACTRQAAAITVMPEGFGMPRRLSDLDGSVGYSLVS